MSLTQGLQIPFGIQTVNPIPVDSWSGPYIASNLEDAIDDANSSIPLEVRFQSMEVRIVVDGLSKKFWYRDGVTDNDLIEFISGEESRIFYISGGFTFSNNTSDSIYRTGSIGIGVGLTNSNRFVVSSAGGTVSLVVTDHGSVYNVDRNNILTNLAFGLSASLSNTTGFNNTSFGNGALYSNTNKSFNLAIGADSLFNNNADYNIGIGPSALFFNTVGTQNTSIGAFAMYYNVNGGFNTAIGVGSLQNGTASIRNTGIGGYSLYNTTGSRNIGIGFFGGSSITTGNDNTIIASDPNNNNEGITTGSKNTLIGKAVTGIKTGSNNTIIGRVSGLNIGLTGSVILADGDNNIRFYSDSVGNVGIGLTGPTNKLHIYSSTSGALRIQDGTEANGYVLTSDSNGVATWNIPSGGTQSLQDTLINGKTASFIDAQGVLTEINLGEYNEDNFNSPISFRQSRTFDDIEQITSIYQELGGVQFSTYINDLLTNVGKVGTIFSGNGNVGLFTQNLFPTFSKDQNFSFEDETVEPSENLEIFYKPNPKYVSGTYYLATLDDGVTEFIELTDVDAPSGYTGQGSKVVAVKADETGLEFVAQSDLMALQILVDTKIGEAPEDGNTYGRKDGSWTQISAGSNIKLISEIKDLFISTSNFNVIPNTFLNYLSTDGTYKKLEIEGYCDGNVIYKTNEILRIENDLIVIGRINDIGIGDLYQYFILTLKDVYFENDELFVSDSEFQLIDTGIGADTYYIDIHGSCIKDGFVYLETRPKLADLVRTRIFKFNPYDLTDSKFIEIPIAGQGGYVRYGQNYMFTVITEPAGNGWIVRLPDDLSSYELLTQVGLTNNQRVVQSTTFGVYEDKLYIPTIYNVSGDPLRYNSTGWSVYDIVTGGLIQQELSIVISSGQTQNPTAHWMTIFNDKLICSYRTIQQALVRFDLKTLVSEEYLSMQAYRPITDDNTIFSDGYMFLNGEGSNTANLFKIKYDDFTDFSIELNNYRSAGSINIDFYKDAYNYIGEAPEDGQEYVRKDGAWTALNGLSGISEIISATISLTASNIQYDFNESSLWYHATASTNYTANFINLPTTNNRTLSVSILIEQGVTAYIPTVVKIAGVTQSLKWAGGSQSGTPNSLDLVTFTFIRINNSWVNIIGQIAPFS